MDKHLQMRYKARDYGSRDSGISLFFFARCATRSVEESGFPEFGDTWVPSLPYECRARPAKYHDVRARSPRGHEVHPWGRVDGVLRAS